VNHSLRQGQLALPITYDDNGYFADALTRLATSDGTGWWFTAKGFIDRPPHSPWSTAVPFLGFALFGRHDFSPALANGFAVVAFLALYAFLTRNLPLRLVLPVIIVALTWPIAGHLVIESRPDVAWGLMVAISVALICVTGLDGSKRLHFGAGALTGLALVSKPPIGPVTIYTVLAALAFSSLFFTGFSAGYKRPAGMFLTACARVLGPAAVIAFPYYYFGGHHVLEYISTHVFGGYKEIWNLKAAWHQHLFYYLLGPGGSMMMGGWIVGWIITVGIASITAMKRKDHGACRFVWAFSATFLATYLAISLAKTKSPYLGAVIPGMALVSWVIAALYLFIVFNDKFRSRFRSLLFGMMLLAFGLAVFDWPWNLKGGVTITNDFRESAHQLVQRVIGNVAREGGQGASVFVAGAGPYLNAATLSYYALKQGHFGIGFRDLHLSDDFAAYKKRIRKSDFVVVFDRNSKNIFRWIPSGNAAFQETVNQYVREAPILRYVGHVTPDTSEDGVVLYQNQKRSRP
jgi:hypothetical protein